MPNPPVLDDPDKAKREALLQKYDNLQQKYAAAKSIDDKLDIENLEKREIDSIDFTFKAIEERINLDISLSNYKIFNLNSEKKKYADKAISIIEEYEDLRKYTSFRVTNRYKCIRTVDIYSKKTALFTPYSYTSKGVIKPKEREELSSLELKVLKYYNASGKYIFEVIYIYNITPLIELIKKEIDLSPQINIFLATIENLCTIDEFIKAISKIGYHIEIDNSGFYKKTMKGHLVFTL